MDAMRWIDHWVGGPLCFALGALASLLRAVGFARSRRISGDRALAVFKFFGLGSIIEATPLLRALRARYPQARVVFVTFAGNAGLVRKLGLCTDVVTIRTDGLLHFAADTLRTMLWLHRQRVEAVLDLEFFSKFSTLLMYLSGARIRIGFHLNDFWRYSLITHPVYFNYYRHITDIYREVGRCVDANVTDTRLSWIDPGPEAAARVAATLQETGWPADALLVGVNINAGDMSFERRWPLERWAELLAAVAERHPAARFVLTGAPDERAYVETLVPLLSADVRGRTLLTAGTWSLYEFCAALARFGLFLTNDSGPMHFAAAAGTPMVSLWGPGRPAFYAPRVPRHETVYVDYPCSPCLYMFTTFEGMWCHHEGWCMQAITAESVLDAVTRVMNAAPAAATSTGVPLPVAPDL
jgi:ADP-heptose:LPS heptosyltransferase